jgi:tetratricopeptide (TPR) repeat protein
MSRHAARYILVAALLGGLLWCADGTAELNLWTSYYFAGTANHDAGEYADAEKLLAAAQGEYLKDPTLAHRRANTLDRIGMTAMALEDFESAERFFKCALELKEVALGPESRTVPVTLNNLGDLYYLCGQKEEAEARYRRALAIHETDQLNIEVARSLNGMALIEVGKGNVVEAEELLRRAVDLHERHMRRLHPYCATAYVNLGTLYTHQDRLDEAMMPFERAMYIQNHALGDHHPDVAVRKSATAAWLAKRGKNGEAARLDREALAVREHFSKLNGKG